MKVNWYRLIGLNLLSVVIKLHFNFDGSLFVATLLGVAVVFLSIEEEEYE